MNKYELTSESKNVHGRTLYRIRALKDFGNVKQGDLGGWIEKESNLSQDGDCWVSDNARVSGKARVYGNAEVYGSAWVYGNARVYGNAEVYGNARVYGEAIATTLVTNLITDTYKISLTDNHIQIGCKQFTFERFMKLHNNFNKVKSQFDSNELDKILPYRNVLVELVKLRMVKENE
jgi:hypothetical protein